MTESYADLSQLIVVTEYRIDDLTRYKNEKMPEKKLLLLISLLLKALHHMESLGITHNDIRLENIFKSNVVVGDA